MKQHDFMKKQNRPFSDFGKRAFAIVVWLSLWQLAAVEIHQKILLVSPIEAAVCFVQMLFLPAFWSRVAFSGSRILMGFGLAVICAVVLAILARKNSVLAALIELPLHVVKATPVASFIILALLWLSSRWLSVLISFLMTLPILFGALQTGMETVDTNLLEMAKVFRMDLCSQLRAIWLPQIFPAFRHGCSVALGICWKSGVAAEVIGLPNGSVGDALYRAKITLSTAEVFAWTMAIVLLSVVFERAFMLLLNKIEVFLTGKSEDIKCSS